MRELLLKPLGRFTCLRIKATWRSGYATVCKTVYPGSIPGVASNKINHLLWRAPRLESLGSVSAV